MKKNPDIRISFDEIVEHPWVSKFCYDSIQENIEQIYQNLPSNEQIFHEIQTSSQSNLDDSLQYNIDDFYPLIQIVKREKLGEEMFYCQPFNKILSRNSNQSSFILFHLRQLILMIQKCSLYPQMEFSGNFPDINVIMLINLF